MGVSPLPRYNYDFVPKPLIRPCLAVTQHKCGFNKHLRYIDISSSFFSTGPIKIKFITSLRAWQQCFNKLIFNQNYVTFNSLPVLIKATVRNNN